jgi:hypothetical protein
MNRVQLAVLAAVALCSGVWMIVVALRPAPPPLAVLRRRLFATPPAWPAAPPPPSGAMTRWITAVSGSRFGIWVEARLGSDLRIADVALPDAVGRLLAGALIIPMFTAVIMSAFIGAGVLAASVWWLVVPIVAAVLGVSVVWSDLRGRADRARRELRQGANDFIQLVAVCLTTHRSIEESALFAARAGEGRGFDLIRSGLEAAPAMGVTAWEALDTIGRTYQIDELVDLAGSVERQAHIGVGVLDTVSSLAAVMRARALDELERAADRTDSTLFGPTMVFVFGVLLLLAYPLTVGITHAFGP